jgi:hypothetical protein
MMNGSPAGLHKTILPLAFGRTPHVWRQQRPPTPGTWQQPPSPINFTTSMPQMMPPAPYHQMHYMGQQFGPPPPQLVQPAPPTPGPQAGTQLMWLSGRLTLLVAEVGGSNPCKTPWLE